MKENRGRVKLASLCGKQLLERSIGLEKHEKRPRKKKRKKMAEQVCKTCHRFVDGVVCPVCGSSSLGRDWTGYLIVIDPKRSEVAKRMNIDLPGRYALKVR